MPTPTELYYYTDAAGLQGILTPQRWPEYAVPRPDGPAQNRYIDDTGYTFGLAAHLMASDVRHMNDTAELSYGARHVAAAFTLASDDSSIDPPLRVALANVAHNLRESKPSAWPWRWCAACFCEDGDLLSQWRGYAGGLGGFAIGFSGEALEHYSYVYTLAARGMMRDLPFPVHLNQVLYGEDAAAARARELVEQLVTGWRDGTLIRDENGGPHLYFVGLEACRVAATLKHIAFEAEREWRLLTSVETGYRTQVRARGGGLLPYVDMVVNPRWAARVEDVAERAVSSVRVGPARDQPGQVDAVKLLLHNRGRDWLDAVDVQQSGTPFGG